MFGFFKKRAETKPSTDPKEICVNDAETLESSIYRLLPKPTEQIQEVLLLLILHDKLSRIDFFRMAGVLNITAVINKLRKRGVDILTETKTVVNKFGREVKVAEYRLASKYAGREYYLKITDKKK